MSIFGPSIKEPKNFNKTVFFKNFINTDNNVFDNVVDGFTLDTLLLDTWSEYSIKDRTKALKKLIATGKAVDKKDNEVLLGADFMQNIVEPLVWAKLNLNTPLSNQILELLRDSRDTWTLREQLYNSLSDEEAKIAAVRRYCNVSPYIQDDVKKLVLNSKYSSLADVVKVFKAEQLTKAEFDAIWGKLKPRLLELMSDNVATEHKTMGDNGVIYLSFKFEFGVEQELLQELIHYMGGIVSDFRQPIIDEHPYEYNGKQYVFKFTLWDCFNSSVQYISKAFVEKIDDIIKYKLPAAMEKDEVKKLQLQKDGLDKQEAAEIQAIKDFVAERKIKIQSIKASKQEIDAKLKAIEEENKRKETERAQAELQKKQAEFEALAAKLGVNPADLLALQKKSNKKKLCNKIKTNINIVIKNTHDCGCFFMITCLLIAILYDDFSVNFLCRCPMK